MIQEIRPVRRFTAACRQPIDAMDKTAKKTDMQACPTMEIWSVGQGLPGRAMPFHVASVPVPANFDPFVDAGLTVDVHGRDVTRLQHRTIKLKTMNVQAGGRQFRVLYCSNILNAVAAAAQLRKLHADYLARRG